VDGRGVGGPLAAGWGRGAQLLACSVGAQKRVPPAADRCSDQFTMRLLLLLLLRWLRQWLCKALPRLRKLAAVQTAPERVVAGNCMAKPSRR
jgi:hypothetical protein